MARDLSHLHQPQRSYLGMMTTAVVVSVPSSPEVLYRYQKRCAALFRNSRLPDRDTPERVSSFNGRPLSTSGEGFVCLPSLLASGISLFWGFKYGGGSAHFRHR